MATTSSVSTTSSGSGITVSGLGSGLDIQGIVDKLMTIESQTQTSLKSKLADHNTMTSAYQGLNSDFASIKTASQALNLGTYWQSNIATSTDSSVTASTTSAAKSGNLTFAVTSLAAAESRITSGSVSSLNASLGNGKTLQGTIDEINNGTHNFTASAVQVAPGQYKMQLTAKDTGTANAISEDTSTYAGNMGTFGTVQAATDASIKVGSGAAAYTISNSSNTLTDVLPGVSLNLTSADPTKQITVKVAPDADGMATKVGALVDSVNAAITLISQNSKYDQSSKNAGLFLGNSTTQRLTRNLHDAISSLVGGDVKLAASVGITSKNDGTFTFDKDKFSSTYKANPEGVAKLFVQGGTSSVSDGTNPGIAERLANVAKLATDSVSGLITTAIKGESSTIADINKSIADWDTRLDKKRTTLLKLYTAMDTAMSSFSAQSTWLTGQISGLASNNNS